MVAVLAAVVAAEMLCSWERVSGTIAPTEVPALVVVTVGEKERVGLVVVEPMYRKLLLLISGQWVKQSEQTQRYELGCLLLAMVCCASVVLCFAQPGLDCCGAGGDSARRWYAGLWLVTAQKYALRASAWDAKRDMLVSFMCTREAAPNPMEMCSRCGTRPRVVKCRDCCCTLCIECDIDAHAAPNLHSRCYGDGHGAAVQLQPPQRLVRSIDGMLEVRIGTSCLWLAAQRGGGAHISAAVLACRSPSHPV